jgi:hypothetical protein
MLSAAAFVLALATAAEPAAHSAPAEAARAFYAAYEPMPSHGLLRPEEMALLEPMMTKRLRLLLEKARAVQAKFAAEHPDEKPPWVDGDLFSSLFEGFRTFRIAGVEPLPDSSWRVLVELSYWEGEERDQQTTWTDAAMVVREGEQFLIDDFEFLGDWPFAQKGRLSDILREEE